MTVLIDEETVYEDVFLAGVKAFVPRLAMGARNAETAGDVLVDEVTLTTGGEPLGRGEPMHLSAIGRQLNDSGNHKSSGIAFFPDDTSDFGRITCTLRLEEPPGGRHGQQVRHAERPSRLAAWSSGFNERVEAGLEEIQAIGNSWINYPLGVLREIREAGSRLPSINQPVTSAPVLTVTPCLPRASPRPVTNRWELPWASSGE